MIKKHNDVWLRFSVQFRENGSDVDTVALLLSSLRGCVIDVDGTKIKYTRTAMHGSLWVFGIEHGTDEEIAVNLTSESTITIL